MPLQATSGAASYDAFGGGVPVVPQYIEEVFSTYLHTGTGSAQTITNGIDLSGKGGLVWTKGRSVGYGNGLFDTIRGSNSWLNSASTDSATSISTWITSFNSNGFGIGTNGSISNSGTTYASWTFRKQPKFFDVVTYTGNGSAGRTLSHSLASQPGFILIKRTDGADPWLAFARLNGTDYSSLRLNTTAAGSSYTQSDIASSTVINVGYINNNIYSCNVSSETYVAYLFAHNAGGFGLTGTDNVISCGSYVSNGSRISVTLGWEPQWILIKKATGASNNWTIVDSMRELTANATNASAPLFPNLSDAEMASSSTDGPAANATGFSVPYSSSAFNYPSGETYIYIAIRRGPMKVPTSGTSVFNSITRTGTGSTANITGAGFPPDMIFNRNRGSGFETDVNDKLRGATLGLFTPYTQAESDLGGSGMTIIGQDGCTVQTDSSYNANGGSFVLNFFRRAPSFFDEVCYTGNGTGGRTVTHNLGVAPELMIFKNRTTSGLDWIVGGTVFADPTADQLKLNTTGALQSGSSWNYTAPTSTTITLSSSANLNANGANYVSYLFATCAGVSKVGSYTGTGTTKQIDCGFTGGARFVLIKRTDSTGSWYVWDVARGISSGNDPYLLLNSTAAEVTNTDYIDAYSAGFEISSTAPAEINASGGSFIFLAIS